MGSRRLAVYVSGCANKETVENFSIDRQLERIHKECKEQGKIVVKQYVDCDISDKTVETPEALKIMLDDCDKIYLMK